MGMMFLSKYLVYDNSPRFPSKISIHSCLNWSLVEACMYLLMEVRAPPKAEKKELFSFTHENSMKQHLLKTKRHPGAPQQ